MKIARFFGVIFGLLGTALMLGSVVLCLSSLNKPAELLETPAAAVECAEEMMEAIAAGDYASAAKVMYGQPDLGVDREPSDTLGVMIWDAFLDSISYEFKGECYATDTGIAWDATVTALDIPSVTGSLNTRVHTLMTQRMENAADMAELYDEENNFREDLVEEVLSQAVVQALAEDGQLVTRDVTLNLICRDGQWWAVPDQALLQAISGGAA